MSLSPFLNVLGVPVSIAVEDVGSRAVVERVTSNGPEADVMFKCPYNQRFTVVRGLLGGVVATGKTLTRLYPLRYPPSPNLFCTSIGDITGLKPFTDGFGWLNYQYSIIPAHFSVPGWDAIPGYTNDPSGKLFTTTRFRVSGQVFSPPIGSYYYQGGTYAGKPVPDSKQSLIRPQVEISMTRQLMPFVPLDAAMTYVGSVNSSSVTIADHVFPRGCLLFMGIDTDPVADPSTGNRCFNIPFSFIGTYQVEWNEVMDPTGAWQLVNDDPGGTGDPPFAYEDFSILFGDIF